MSVTDKPWPFKYAAEIDFRGIDWAKDLDTGETITAYDFTPAEDSGIALEDKNLDGTSTIGKFSGGEVETWTVTATITTSTGRELVVEKDLEIR